MTAWLALLDAPPPDPDLTASAGAVVLAGWRSARQAPHPEARRVDPRLLDPSGPGAWASLVWPAREVMPLFDDPAVLQGRRVAQRGIAPRAVSTFVIDSTHFAGSIWVVTHPSALADDPFCRLGTRLVLEVAAGLLGSTARPPGPALERYSGAPWPWDGSSARMTEPRHIAPRNTEEGH
ncbi:MAG: hypothetical protein LC749_00760 [Actinobacteria bacterium]|nr:hypothetical protein [Actinomycetota bacterium]